MGGMQWARLSTPVDCPLRRGAWYRVVSLTRLEAVVSVEGASISVARPFVEVRSVPPRDWTIVRPVLASRRVPDALESGYVVCPNCRTREVLPFAHVAKLRCPRCNELSPIAWDEDYFKKA